MHDFLRNRPALATVALALAVAAGPAPAFSAGLAPEAVAAHRAAAATRGAERAQRAAAPAGQAKAMGSQVYPGTPHANPYRAYPPSCAADPLPDAASGTILASRRVPLLTTDDAYTETVTVTVWRVACSSSGGAAPYNTDGGANAMVLMRIDRDDDTAVPAPRMPIVQAKVAGESFPTDYSDTSYDVRVPLEPNTTVSDVYFDTPIYGSSTFVLENQPYEGARFRIFNYAFTLRIDPVLSNVAPVDIDIPDYVPDAASYPDAFAPLPLDGYAAAQWVNDSLGQGLLMQVSEQYDAQGNFTRQAVFDLLTKDTDGNPFWLVGNAAFPVGATRLDVDIAYLGNQNQQVPWGRATLQLASCNELDIAFTPNAGLAAPVPTFGGDIAYARLFNENGMTCE